MPPSPSPSSAGSSSKIAQILVQAGFLTDQQLTMAIKEMDHSKLALVPQLIKMGFLTDNIRVGVLKQALGHDILDLRKTKIKPAAQDHLRRDFCEKQRVFPLHLEGKKILVVAMEDPTDERVVTAMHLQSGFDIKPVISLMADMDTLLNRGHSHVEKLQRIPLAQRHWFYRFMHGWSVPILIALPLPIFIGLVMLNEDVNNAILGGTRSFFDVGVYCALAWGLWSVVVYLIMGNIFKPEPKDED